MQRYSGASEAPEHSSTQKIHNVLEATEYPNRRKYLENICPPGATADFLRANSGFERNTEVLRSRKRFLMFLKGFWKILERILKIHTYICSKYISSIYISIHSSRIEIEFCVFFRTLSILLFHRDDFFQVLLLFLSTILCCTFAQALSPATMCSYSSLSNLSLLVGVSSSLYAGI